MNSFIFKISVLVVAIYSVEVFGSDCDVTKCIESPKHYEELGCEPIKKVGDCCPRSFDCKHLEGNDGKKCHFKGKTYNEGDKLNDLLLSGSCEGSCRCEKQSFVCEHINCEERYGPPLEPGCVRKYSNDKCCSTETVCGEGAKKLASCEFEGKTYREGEQMQPRDHKCHKCICSRNFEDKPVLENKDCAKIGCLIELFDTENVRQGCVPIYHADSCCPYDWRCPTKSDALVPADQTKKPDPEAPKCKFGNLILEIGDSLSRGEDGCAKCTCETPPFVDCVFSSC